MFQYCENLPVADINDIFLKEFSLDEEFGKFLIEQEQNRDIIMEECKKYDELENLIQFETAYFLNKER